MTDMNLQSLPRLLAGLLAATLIVLSGTAQGAAPGLPTSHVTADSSVAAAATPQPLVQRASDEYLSHVQFTNEAEAAAIAPVPTDFNLIRPGQLLLTTIPGQGTFICSASFVFKDNKTPVNYYLATAGHCVLPPTAVSTHGTGANYNPSGVVVSACYANCYLGGELSGLLASFATVGPVVYARQSQATAAVGCVAGQIGNDFALVKISPTWYTAPWNIVTPRMAVWSGPYVFGLGVEGTGKLLVHHGNGIELGTAEPTKARAGVSLDDGILCSFQALISVAGGDSGSAISLAMAGATPEPVLSGGEALGTITHALAGAAPPAYGTTVYRAIGMAKTDANLTISLCMASTTIPGC
ncbi:MAG: hypothetical protein LC623_01250 [Halobacteriales archaeon]|nr:hypothetical protein [Halobacteriales archaeon]